jgi:hypothetical protein
VWIVDGYAIRTWGQMRGSDGSCRWYVEVVLAPPNDSVLHAARETGIRVLHRLVRDSAGEILGCPTEERMDNPPRLRLEVRGHV